MTAPPACAHEWREMRSATDPYRDDECKFCGVAKAEAMAEDAPPAPAPDESQRMTEALRGLRDALAARDAEIAKLYAALRDLAIDERRDPSGFAYRQCGLCGDSWRPDEKESHARFCLAGFDA